MPHRVLERLQLERQGSESSLRAQGLVFKALQYDGKSQAAEPGSAPSMTGPKPHTKLSNRNQQGPSRPPDDGTQIGGFGELDLVPLTKR